MANTRSDKERFFTELELLDCLSDDSAEDEFSRVIALSRPSSKQEEGSCLEEGSESHHDETQFPRSPALVRRSTTPSILRSSSPGRRLDGSAVENVQSFVVKRSNTTGSSMENRTMAAGKRKRAYSARTVPEHLQVFKGLGFFFFPNNDVSPLRRLRIQRAQEYGALWEKSWGDGVTHVIVDKGLTFQDVLKHLKLDVFPTNIALVDESYPSECIKFRSLLSTTHVRFRVRGMPGSSEMKNPEPSTGHATADVLPLKPPKKAPPPPTPSQGSQSFDHAEVIPESQSEELVKEREVQSTHEGSPSRERDILDDIIDEAKTVKDLPLESLDCQDEDSSAEASDAGDFETSDPETDARKRRKHLHKEAGATENWQQGFACMQAHDARSDSDNPNGRTIEVLQQMLDYYTRTDDHWRVLAYRKTISALRKQSNRITTRTQALAIPGIGTRLADKIEEIVYTDRLRRLENTSTTPEDRILQQFMGVYGAGLSQASRWLAQGYRSLEDLKAKAHLTQAQRIGVDHYDDFLQQIPRKEVEMHGEIVRRAVVKVNPGMQVIISGSYRRGAADSGDIDVLITQPDATIEQIRAMMMDTVIPDLFQQGFLQASLAVTSRGDGSKWHGASKLPDSRVWRRLDLLFVPGSEIGAALIYFTGNDIFNRSMRLLARKKGMRLNQRGLYADVLRGPQQTKMNAGRLLEGRDERRIFEILGVPWRPPEQRIC
ncbi:hypothetical protein HFD88_006700 [Aspergillus terreus]|nr:hypothetical protein HFD88_006700 [Aspergillus terreus]